MLKFIKKYHTDLLALGLIFAVVTVFLARLFWPDLATIATHEIGVTDVWHLNYPFKFFYAQALKSGFIPIWNDLMGGGFPILAEGETGIFNLENLVLYRLLPVPWAFNLQYVLIFFQAGAGMYLLARYFKMSRIAGLFAAIIFALSGYFVTHMSNLTNIHAASYLPWIILLSQISITGSAVYYLLYAFILSQLIFVGFQQVTFIGLLMVGFFWVYRIILRQAKAISIVYLSVASTWAAVMSAVQILPSLELSRLSSRGGGLPFTELLYYKFPWPHLASFWRPFAFGNPQIGTYPHFQDFDGSLFWENTPYFGLVPWLFLVIFILAIKRLKGGWYLALGALGFLLLAVGGDGPLYFILLLPPFSLFRFPSRFLLPVVFLSALMAAAGFQRVGTRWKNFRAGVTVIILLLVDLFSVWFGYHYVLKYSGFAAPESVGELQKLSPRRIFTYNSASRAFREFSNRSEDKLSRYMALRNDLIPNSNILYELSGVNYYATLYSRRHGIFKELLDDINLESTPAGSVNPNLRKFLDLRGVTHITSPNSLTNSGLILKKSLDFSGLEPINLYIYENKQALPELTAYNHTRKIETLEQFGRIFTDSGFDITTTALVETDIPGLDSRKKLQYRIIRFNYNRPQHTYTAEIEVNQKSVIMTGITYYPGWVARIDNAPHDVIPVDLIHAGVAVPPGRHRIELSYRPGCVKFGAIISLMAHIILIISAVFYFRRRKNLHK